MPFSEQSIREMLKQDPKNPAHVVSRENSRLEFKESFSLNSLEKYGRTIAAFANAQGGYLVFGVRNRPRLLVGLQNKAFENADPEAITEFLNATFAPEIAWEMHVSEVNGYSVGLVYVRESGAKPVICTRNIGQLRESDIYYRYRGRTERIKYAELRALLEAEREKERLLWLRHLAKMARIGVQNVGIMDTGTGEVTGAGGSFLISEDLLPKLRFIRDGHFVESDGAPALRLIGDVAPVGSDFIRPVKKIFEPHAIHTADIVDAFLDRARVVNPMEYVRQICFEASGFLPVYYFLTLAKVAPDAALEQVRKVPARTQSKTKLIERMEGSPSYQLGSLTAGTKTATKRRQFFEQIRTGTLPDTIPDQDIQWLFQAATHLGVADFSPEYLFPRLKQIFDAKFSTVDGGAAGDMRKALCHLDRMLYAPRPASTVEKKPAAAGRRKAKAARASV